MAWLTEWERNGDPIARTKLINGLTTIAAMPNGWAEGDATYNLADGRYTSVATGGVSVGSASARCSASSR